MSTMKVFALVFLSGPLHGEAACPCIATPAEPNQTAAAGAPAYVGETPAYGWGCMAHDQDQGDCATSNETGKGQADDWCLDKWCIVDPANCDHKTRLMTYTADPNDYFSYEACDASFTGNGWVGRCKNCDAPHVNSFCTCGGLPGCMCLAGSTKQTSAVGKPKFVGEVPAFGWGCKAHDQGQDMCATSNKTGKGQADDWCLDKWCIVDPATCDQKTRKMSYTAEPNDFFSYEACDANFTGNGWVGRCKNCDAPNVNSFCTCGGLSGCECLPGSTKQKILPGKPAYAGEVPAYGWGCKAHDKGYGSCANSTKTATGQADDWCLDKWCLVNPTTCKFKTTKSGYTADPDDAFSYETCDANFTGNSWVGRCKCASPNENTHCSCPAGTTGGTTGNTTGGNAGGSTTTTFTGKLTLSLSGATKAQMETAMKASLAAHFGVAESGVTVTATESRRLSEARNLAGSWSIAYSFTVPTSQAATVATKVAATKTDSTAMKTVLKKQLVDAGVPQTQVDAMTITGFTATNTVSEGTGTSGSTSGSTTGGTTTVEETSSAHDLVALVVPQFVLALALIFHA